MVPAPCYQSDRQEIDPNRVNAVGVIDGSGRGTSLQINGHMDTSFTGTEEDRLFCAELEPVSELRGAIRDGKVFGLGASNMKSGVAAFMIAGKALKQSAVRLTGDLIMAAVAGEISRTPIGPYQSGSYRGEGTGTRHLLTHGIQSDYAICADRSGHSIVWAQNGVVQLRINTFGNPHAAWGVTREQEPPEENNAVLEDDENRSGRRLLGGGFREAMRLSIRHRPDSSESQHRRYSRRRAVSAQLLSRRLLALR